MVGLTTSKPPMVATGELAGALAELRGWTPEYLRQVEAATKDFYEGAEKYAAEKEAAEKALTALADDKAAHAAKAQADNADIAERNRMATDRENNLAASQRNIRETMKGLEAREQAVADAERRLAAARQQLEGFSA